MNSNQAVRSRIGPALLDKLLKRKLIENIYPDSSEYRDKLDNMLKQHVTVYAGFDATASTLHVGNLATIMNLIHFQRHGHRVICVVGDATTQLGDPSGHTKDRARIDKDVISQNADSIEETLRRLFHNHKLHLAKNNGQQLQDPIIVRNSQWYKGKNVIDFVGEMFCHVRVGALLHKKSISERLKTRAGMNMAEFCYQIFQAYDWLELDRKYNCRLQVGGSDQAGNIYTGHDLSKKILGHADSIGLLAPLVTNDAGFKLGKTSKNSRSNIWLTSDSTSPYELYQFFHRTPDNSIEKFLKVFSLFDDEDIEDLIRNHLKKAGDFWYCQRKLAENVCLLVHGEAGLEDAKNLTRATYHHS